MFNLFKFNLFLKGPSPTLPLNFILPLYPIIFEIFSDICLILNSCPEPMFSNSYFDVLVFNNLSSISAKSYEYINSHFGLPVPHNSRKLDFLI